MFVLFCTWFLVKRRQRNELTPPGVFNMQNLTSFTILWSQQTLYSLLNRLRNCPFMMIYQQTFAEIFAADVDNGRKLTIVNGSYVGVLEAVFLIDRHKRN